MKENLLAERIRRFAARLEKEDVNMHGFLLSVKGQLKARAYYAPFREGQPHRMYSVSKTMTGIAIGMLADDGKLNLNQRLAEFFPDWLPANPSPFLTALTLRDMLRMATCYRQTAYQQPAYQQPQQPKPAQQEAMDISLGDNPTDDLPF